MAGRARAGLETQKKRLAASERDEAARARWREQNAGLKAEDLVFVDESGANLALAPRYGWAPGGRRACGQAPCNRGRNTTLLAAMTRAGLLASMTVKGAANTAVFLTYLDHVLCPALRPGQVVILDNLSVHKNAAVAERIAAAGCRLLFLPTYSPDFNPTEGAFSKLKACLRRAAARTREALEAAITAGLATIRTTDAQGWFKHCGYHPWVQPA